MSNNARPRTTREPPMPTHSIELRVGARTSPGMVREHNEDTFVVTDLASGRRDVKEDAFKVGPHGHLLAVCDGMGGAAAGEVASRMAADIVLEELARSRGESRATTHTSLARRLVAAIHRASEQINDEALRTSKLAGMGTTVTASAIIDDYLIVAQVGDSRAYLLRDGYLTQLTRDQSLFEKLLEASALSPEQAETFDHGNVILQALGALRDVEVEMFLLRLNDGDKVLICSDGLHGLITDAAISNELATNSDPSEICDRLIALANDAGGADNITVVIATVSCPELRAPAPLPIVKLDESGNTLRFRPLPDPRNLLGIYAPRIKTLAEGDADESAERISAPPMSTPSSRLGLMSASTSESSTPAAPAAASSSPSASVPPATTTTTTTTTSTTARPSDGVLTSARSVNIERRSRVPLVLVVTLVVVSAIIGVTWIALKGEPNGGTNNTAGRGHDAGESDPRWAATSGSSTWSQGVPSAKSADSPTGAAGAGTADTTATTATAKTGGGGGGAAGGGVVTRPQQPPPPRDDKSAHQPTTHPPPTNTKPEVPIPIEDYP